MMPVQVFETRILPIDLLEPNPWNPNEEEEGKFNQLVESMRQDGFTQPVSVVPLPTGRYRIIGGEHRWRAGRVLEMTEIPCTICEGWDEDTQKFQTMKQNLIHGRLSPTKFLKLWNDVTSRYPAEAVKRLMGFTSEQEFERVYRAAREALPPELRKRLDAAKKEIHTIEDLGRILNRIFAEHGATLKQNFLVFNLGGKEHVMVQCEPEVWRLVRRLLDECVERKVDVNEPLFIGLKTAIEGLETFKPIAEAARCADG